MKAPHPRYRLYTSWNSYLPFLRDLLLARDSSSARKTFLERLSTYLDAEHVTTVAMCRTAIYLAVKHLVRPGQDVVMSPYTIADAVNMVVLAGGHPVFADIDRSSCSISVGSVESLIHADTGAVLVTHLHGIPAPINEISDLCRASGVPVIEDAAQAFGARVDGRRLGTFADVGVYSFGTYKNINAWYGGAITCKNPDLFAAIAEQSERFALQSKAFLIQRVLKGLATEVATSPLVFRSFTYWVFRLGRLHDIQWINRLVETELDLERRDNLPRTYLGRMTPAQHRLALLQLDHIDRDNQVRIRKAAQYREGLQDLPALLLPPSKCGEAIYTYFPVQYGGSQAERQRLLWHLAARGCDIGAQHLRNCADLPAFRDFYRDCPNSRRAAQSVVLLPTYPAYPERDIARNVALLRRYASSPSR